MRLFVFLFFASFLIGCGSGDHREKTGEVRLDFSLDTVIVDGGEQLVFPYLAASRSFFTDNKRFLFNFNDFDHTVEKIDLEKLKLAGKYPLEKEGPNGTGEYVDYLVLLDSGKLLIQTSNQAGIFDWEGNKLREFDPLLEGASLMHVDRKTFQPVKVVGDQIYGLIVDNAANTGELGYYGLSRDEFSYIPLAKDFRHGDFNLEHREGNSRRRYAPGFVMQAYGENMLVVGSTVSSTVFIFDPETQQFAKKECNLSLTASEKKGVYRLATEDKAAFQRAYVALYEEVSFGPLIWDVENERYFRFYYEYSYPDELPPGGFPRPVSTVVYLMVLDNELNLLHETSLPQLDHVPYFSFAKDDKIWIFVNLEDELGFVRMSIDL
ncbi:protein of unknown function [Cyclobacterium xiamenense]|uniref:TolB-like 6-blade propeller-like n=1 Tax=Cyclobacterium xiamenense TaxID=1297121 RepID=A0A1H6XNJ5_9BACT|nr:DUF4221 family protein [Cyclobacterium xiamenense]SEJ30658.1 protein of unknown function [Cyclobacterium xiamenense]